ncbi:MAG TPA: sigma-70 family RNA polymerase sigma factor [Polyangiaceae bacterium]|nr:sigma-70 family RNA polymerase sigma factor [Polyangiaceae bacterium]
MYARRACLQETRWSLVLRAGGPRTDASRRALAELCSAYRPPLVAWARHFEADPERAEDVVQGFFARLVERDLVSAADPTRGRLRAFLRTALRHYAINVHDAANAQKRKARLVDAGVDELASGAPSAERLCDRLWSRTLLDRALARLSDEQVRAGKGARFHALQERLVGDDEPRALRDVAADLGVSTGSAKVILFRLRQRFAEIVREEVADTVVDAEDVDAEIRDLLDVWRDDDAL